MSRADFFDTLVSARPDDWTTYTRHRFVVELGSGELPMACFRTYLLQDYLFLVQFARAYALALFKSRNLADMRSAAAGISAILDRELDLHIRYCRGWGIEAADLTDLPEHRATVAYTRYVIDTGLQGDLLDLLVALAPCVVGYAEIAVWLAPQQPSDSANPYADWIAEYAGSSYRDVAVAARRHLDELAARTLAPGRFDEVADIFARACRLEADFWQMGLDAVDPIAQLS
jgi:thiaminase/transcriptional activator TenA